MPANADCDAGGFYNWPTATKTRFPTQIRTFPPPYKPILTRFPGHQTAVEVALGEIIVTIKNVVIPLETAYLQDEAKRLGVSRTKLVRVVMEKIVRDELVPEILDGETEALNEPPPTSKYRRFPRKNCG
jgi:hypothetical protein